MRPGLRITIFTRPSFLPETNALQQAFTTPASDARLAIIDRNITALKAAGIHDQMDAYWFMAAHAAQAGQQNWKNPGTYTLSPQNSPTFAADRGYTGNGSNMYLKTGLTLSTAVKYQQNSGSLGVFVRTAGTGLFSRYISAENGGTSISAVNVAGSADAAGLAANVATAGVVNVASVNSNNSLLVADRDGSASLKGYRNGAQVGSTSTSASVAVPAYEVYLLARNNAGVASNLNNGQISFAYVGSSLTTDQHAALNTIVNTYLTAVGAI